MSVSFNSSIWFGVDQSCGNSGFENASGAAAHFRSMSDGILRERAKHDRCCLKALA